MKQTTWKGKGIRHRLTRLHKEDLGEKVVDKRDDNLKTVQKLWCSKKRGRQAYVEGDKKRKKASYEGGKSTMRTENTRN